MSAGSALLVALIIAGVIGAALLFGGIGSPCGFRCL